MKLNKEKINLAMSRKSWTTSDLANAYGSSRNRIAVIFNSQRVTPKTAGKLATALGVDVTEILED